MNDTRTQAEKYAAWVATINKTHEKGWECLSGWLFASPQGNIIDLSASDLDKLDQIDSTATAKRNQNNVC